VQVTVPVLPTDGVVQFQAIGYMCNWYAVAAGSGTVRVTPAAGLGPLLVTVSV
jgi:hypothetical protein